MKRVLTVRLQQKLDNAFSHCPHGNISHIFKTMKKQSQTTPIYPHMDILSRIFPHFPMPRIFTYILVYGQKTGELHHKQN